MFKRVEAMILEGATNENYAEIPSSPLFSLSLSRVINRFFRLLVDATQEDKTHRAIRLEKDRTEVTGLDFSFFHR